MAKGYSIPPTKGDVLKHNWHTNRDGESTVPNLSVEEARANMLAAREAATTVRGGVRVPKFIAEDTTHASGLTTQLEPEPATRGTGGSTPTQSSSDAELAASAQRKMFALGIPKGSRVDLDKLTSAQIITAEERIALLRSVGVIREPAVVAPAVAATVTPEEPVVQEMQAVSPAVEPQRIPVTPSVPSAVSPEPQEVESQGKETIADDKNHTVLFYKEGKEWIGEIVSKRGHGTQRYLATNKDDLIRKVLIAQANATKKIRDQKEEIEYGDRPDTWDNVFQFMNDELHITTTDWGGMPQQVKDLTIANLQAEQVRKFQEDSPNAYFTEANFEAISKYLEKRQIPMTFHNLRLAWNKLSDDDMLEIRPTETSVSVQPAVSTAVSTTVSVPAVTPVVANSTPGTVQPAAPALAEPVVTASVPAVRKRGTTGIMPGSSAATPTATEEGTIPRKLSEKELREMSISDLKRIATQDRKFYRS